MTIALLVTSVAATVAAGLVAGFLATFAHTVMPALARTDDATMVGVFRALDRAVSNAWFMVPFTMLPVLVSGGWLLALGTRQWSAAALLGAAVATALATFGVTAVVHLPLNRRLGGVAPGDSGTLHRARVDFERRWVRWNVVRTVTATACLGLLATALLQIS